MASVEGKSSWLLHSPFFFLKRKRDISGGDHLVPSPVNPGHVSEENLTGWFSPSTDVVVVEFHILISEFLSFLSNRCQLVSVLSAAVFMSVGIH